MLHTQFDVALVDLDGVVYLGNDPVSHAVPALNAVANQGMALAYVTNNAGRTPDEVASHLCELGLTTSPEQVVTSAQAGAKVLRERLGGGPWPVLVVGGPGVRAAVLAQGMEPVDSADDDPVAVLQGFGRDLCWADLDEASAAVGAGALWIATNPDVSIPTPRGRAPGNGAFVHAVSLATGRSPDQIAGKPHAPLMLESIARTGALRPLVIGDRLDTDIAAAAGVGIVSLLVFTGVSTISNVLRAPSGQRPDLMGLDLRTLFDVHPPVHRQGQQWRAGPCSGGIDDRIGQVVLQGPIDTPADWATACRVACAVAWATAAATDLVAQRLIAAAADLDSDPAR